MIDVLSFAIHWLTYFTIYAILAITLVLEAGISGITNFGKVAFFGLGAYIGAVVNTYTLLALLGYDVNTYTPFTAQGISVLSKIAASEPIIVIMIFFMSLAISFVITGLFGRLLIYPVIRVGAGFVGFTLLSVGEILRAIYMNTHFLGGTYGMFGIPQPFTWLRSPVLSALCYLAVTFSIFLSAYILVSRIHESPLGRVLRAIRDDDVAALFLGKDVPRIKSSVFFLTSGLSGVAGALYACYVGSVNPQMFVVLVTFNVWAMIIIGGSSSPMGAVLGAALLSLVDRLLQYATPVIGGVLFSADYLRPIFIGCIMIAILVKKPMGLLPEKPPKITAGFLRKALEEIGEVNEGGCDTCD
ncbi:MAG: branched-chain amino acid ABC transporter permease [Desulfurococcaceae archaeon]